MENAFLPMVKTIPCLEKHIELRRKAIIPYLSTNRNSQIELKYSSFSVEIALSTALNGFPPHQAKTMAHLRACRS